MTHALLAGSAAIDAGRTASATISAASSDQSTAMVTPPRSDVGASETNAALVTYSPAVRRPLGFSLADKFGEGVADPVIHLRGYEAKEADGELPHTAQLGIRIRNQLGELRLDTVKVERLLVPSSKDLIAPPLPPGASNVDDFKCYKVKTTRGTAKLAKGLVVDLQDQFAHRLFDVVKPTRLCLAVNRAGGGVLHPTDHLMCYQVKLSKPKPVSPAQAKHTAVDAFTANDLDDETLTTIKEEEFCVPSTVTP